MNFIGTWIVTICLPALSPGAAPPAMAAASQKERLPFAREGILIRKATLWELAKDSLPFASFFDDEIRPPASIACFQGAYYRKIVSGTDRWLGVGGSVVLPHISFDEGRKNPARPGQYLDNPSLYMGGNMNGQETDIGLTWSVTKDKHGHVSRERNAFRPFFRRSGHGGQDPVWINAPASPGYYWYPGEEVQMSLQVVAAGKVKLIVEGAGKRYEAVFDCAGYRPGDPGEFKRVDAIDQVGNEGKSVQPTTTRVSGAVWKETHLYRRYKGQVVRVPFSDRRYTDMRCPDPEFFQIESTADDRSRGAEQISISGSGF